MTKSQGQFILMDIDDFSNWLNGQNISRSIKRIQNHHTWKPRYENFKNDNHFVLLKGMKRSHLKRGFSDIAQNFTTFPDGTIAVCRPLKNIPAGIKGANSGGICIEHIGNFDKGGDRMKKKHKDTIISLSALLCQKFNLAPDVNTLVYHHWWDLNTGKRKDGKGVTKSCPGTNFFGGNTVEDAKRNFIPKVIHAIEHLDSDLPVTDELLYVRYSKTGPVEYGKELQQFLNGFPGIKLKVDGWPGKKTSDAFKQVCGYYLKGDPRG